MCILRDFFYIFLEIGNLTEIYPILNSVKKKEESKKAILNKPKL